MECDCETSLEDARFEEAKSFILVNSETLEHLSSHSDGCAFLIQVYTNLDKSNFLTPHEKEMIDIFCSHRSVQERFEEFRRTERAKIKKEWGEQ